MKLCKNGLILIILLLMSLASSSDTKRIYPFKGGVKTRAEKGLTRQEIAFQQPEGSFFTQSWTFVYYLDDASCGYLQFTYMRMGYLLERISAQHSFWDSREKKLRFQTALTGGSDYAQNLDPWSLRLGRQKISGFYPEFRVSSDLQDIQTDLHFHCKVPGWRPGESPTHYLSPDGDWYDFYLVIPWAKMEGTFTVDGEVREVHGHAYMDHNVQTAFFTSQVKTIYALRSFSSHYAIHFLEYIAPENYEPRRLPWLLVMKDDKILFATDKYTIEPSEFLEDDRADCAYPTFIKVNVDLPECKLSGTIQCTEFLEFLDVMDQLPGWIRDMADRFFKQPAFTRQRAKVNWHLNFKDIDENISAEGIFEVAYVN
jgi:hypothetical protein